MERIRSVPIVEKNARESLDAVLKEVADLNAVCTVLVGHSFEKLGTSEAKVVLRFEKGKCERPKPAGRS
jgi:ABC-type sulfate/molybdate transport systems ATPase subunit